MEADDLRESPAFARETEDGVRITLGPELVPPEDFVGLVGEADSLRHRSQ